MCSVGAPLAIPIVSRARCEQMRGDFADARLHWHEADEIAVEFGEYFTDPGLAKKRDEIDARRIG